MNYQYLVFLCILLITLIIFYLFGLSLVNKVEEKMKNIQINVPKQEVIISYPDTFNNLQQSESLENFENKQKEVSRKTTSTQFVVENKGFIEKNGKSENMDIDKIDPTIDEDFFENSEMNIEGFDKQDRKNNQQSWENPLKSSHICFKNHKHDKACSLGTMNYADPKDMSEMDYNIFVLTYPSNMTLQDYIHWLWCYDGKEYQLTYNHLKNLQKLKNGEPLYEQKGVLPPPGYEQQPLTSEEYFNKMYAVNNEFNMASALNSQTGPMLGYNYDEYSEFSQNRDLKGSSSYMRNCDIGMKKDALEVRNFVFPKDSQNLEIDKEYNIYRHKKVEI